VRGLGAIVCGAFLTAAACTGSGYEPVAETEGTPRVSGALFVEHAQGATTTPGVQVGARFVRVVGIADETLPDLVGTPSVPRVGACVEHGATTNAGVDATHAEVRLLDVGSIDVRAGDRSLRMVPRRFPDLWNVVSGVLYGVEADMPLGTWRFSVEGSPQSNVGGFEVSAQFPEALTGVRVGDTAFPLDGTLVASFPKHTTLPVRWNRTTTDDRIAIVFEGDGSIICGSRDEGAFDIDPATVDRAREILRHGGTVSVHRMRTRPFATQGLDSAALVFDLSVRGRAKIE
jgi:hypothetical protein